MPPRERVRTDASIESMRFGPKQHPTEAERTRRCTWQANDALTALNADDSVAKVTRKIAKRVIDHFRGLNLNVKDKEQAALEAVRAQLVKEHQGQLPYQVMHGLEIGYGLLVQTKSPGRNAPGKP